MGAMRVTPKLLIDRALRNINQQSVRILGLQEQLASGLRVNRPADNPIAARRAVNTRSLIEKNEQYISSISFIGSPLQETATSIQTVLDGLNRAWELTLQGANGTNDQLQRDNIAQEINQLLEGLVNTANHVTNGRYIFGGSRTRSIPFVVTRNAQGEIAAVTYEGNDERLFAQISDNVNVAYNETGAQVFAAAQDIFQALISTRDDLRANNQSDLQNVRLDEYDTAREQLLASLARVGSVQNRVERATDELVDFNLQLQALLSDTIDADFAEVVLNLNAQSNAFQAALSAAARAVQPSLLDFVR